MAQGIAGTDIHVCSYVTLNNEVTIKDIADGFDRSMRANPSLHGANTFNVMVHSTGMLVFRSWFAFYGKKRGIKINNVIAIAPATFGSPVAHQGRSWLGSLVKGNKTLGPDFLNAGDLVLDGLELGSRFTWQLAHKDLVCPEAVYGADPDTPYFYTFCGIKPMFAPQNWLDGFKGSDGVVRWAGSTVNTRKITLDFTQAPDDPKRAVMGKWLEETATNRDMPFIPITDLDHGGVLVSPTPLLKELVWNALKVDSKETYLGWVANAKQATQNTLDKLKEQGKVYQQLVVHAVDERGDGIPDFHLDFYMSEESGDIANLHDNDWKQIRMDRHVYTTDSSYQCYHVDLGEFGKGDWKNLKLEIYASTGTQLLTYTTHLGNGQMAPDPGEGVAAFVMDLKELIANNSEKLLYPYTTTLLEIILERGPTPLVGQTEIAKFIR